ncbi:uncharacterized protein LOC131236834 [Magnolia sinica]|uniref:uncharacterized protein LOC131236834 n=1 Tax=Magnolia sinica TaxID=86752 RepID=UPI0026591EE4|nr:uncharacterized protein LOC131236834 [Magnolia sinica]
MESKRAERTRKTGSDKSCLPSCFGFSGSFSGRGKKEKRRFSWWRSWIKKPGIKTVPVDVATVRKATRGNDDDSEIEEGFVSCAGKRQIAGDEERNAVAVSDQGVVGKSGKPKYGCGQLSSAAEILTAESRNANETSVSTKEVTCQRTAQTPRKTRSGSGSPQIPSSPFLPPGRRKQAHPTGNFRLAGQKHDRKSDIPVGKFDPVVGLSVLMVILAIMLVWGRTCAIVCTSAWFYFIPCLRTTENSGEAAGELPETVKIDVDSEEYKKKIILEGLLERNRRNPPVIL